MFDILVSILSGVAAFIGYLGFVFVLIYASKNYDVTRCKRRGSNNGSNAHTGSPSVESHVASSENMNPMAEIHVVQPASATQTI